MTNALPAPRPVAVLTAFRAPDDLVERVADLTTQVSEIVIVDDGTHSLARLGLEGPSVTTIELDENVGIAAALNVGIRKARDLGATHVVTLDQDSALPEDYVHDALELLGRLRAEGRSPAAVVPERIGGITASVPPGSPHPRDPIQSGQVVPIEIFDEVGGFDERLFIDGVDTEFTLRARAAGFDFWPLPGSDLAHSLGETTPIMIFGRQLTLWGKKRNRVYHAPFRTYYAMRNGLALWGMHRQGNVRWLARRTLAVFWVNALGLLLSGDRAAQWVATLHGLRDGIRMRLGPIPERTLQKIARRR
jgi:rhamnosyltransferase